MIRVKPEENKIYIRLNEIALTRVWIISAKFIS